MNRRRFARGAAGVLLAALARAGRAAEAEVEIVDYSFRPARLVVAAGTTVRWTNREKRVSHSVRFTGEGGFEGDRIFPGESWVHRFERPGRYAYTCGPHPEMAGVVEVEP